MDGNNTGKIWERFAYGPGKDPIKEDLRSHGED
jgi:hypothetical protein